MIGAMKAISLALGTLALGLCGCATNVFNSPTNAPLTKDTPTGMGAPVDILGVNNIALSFSGGGLRAAAFAHGVLEALAETKTATGDLSDDVAFISSVSGGSITAAHFGLYGRQGLATFRENVLLRDYEQDMRLSLNPANLMRMFNGGLNAKENLGDSLDRHAFHNATFADLYRRGRPDVRIHATDLYNRLSFPFIPRVFQLLCSDIRSYSVSDAVVASMAVPLVFAPVVVRTYPDRCNEPLPAIFEKIRVDQDAPRTLKALEHGMSAYRDPSRMRFVKLVDGGVSDNFGLATIAISRAVLGTPYAPMTERDAVKVRRMLFIVVDASRGPNGDWAQHEEGPSGVDLALIVTDAATDSSSRFAADGFGAMLREWRDSLIHFRCGLGRDEVERLGGPKEWHCEDVRFYLAFLSIDRLEGDERALLQSIPTRLTLSAEQIDAAIQAAKRGTLALPRLRQFLLERVNANPSP
jgi:NTE family protein